MIGIQLSNHASNAIPKCYTEQEKCTKSGHHALLKSPNLLVHQHVKGLSLGAAVSFSEFRTIEQLEQREERFLHVENAPFLLVNMGSVDDDAFQRVNLERAWMIVLLIHVQRVQHETVDPNRSRVPSLRVLTRIQEIRYPLWRANADIHARSAEKFFGFVQLDVLCEQFGHCRILCLELSQSAGSGVS